MYPTHLQYHDDELRDRILTCVRSRSESEISDLKVEVDGGVATVTGRISSNRERDRCLQYCEHVPGVVRIIDALQLKVLESDRTQAMNRAANPLQRFNRPPSNS